MGLGYLKISRECACPIYKWLKMYNNLKTTSSSSFVLRFINRVAFCFMLQRPWTMNLTVLICCAWQYLYCLVFGTSWKRLVVLWYSGEKNCRIFTVVSSKSLCKLNCFWLLKFNCAVILYFSSTGLPTIYLVLHSPWMGWNYYTSTVYLLAAFCWVGCLSMTYFG